MNRRAGKIPYALLAAVLVPVSAGYVWVLRGAEGFRFAHPGALALIPIAVALVLWAGLRRAPGRRAVLTYSRASELAERRPGLVARLQDLPLALRLATVALVGLALARPQTSRVDDDLELEGIDIVIALDVSGSMEERDLVPNRLDAAKAVIEDFVRRRRSDRIGLVVFAREAYTHVPLTLDHQTFLRMLAELHVGIIDGQGTAIGNGIGVALNRLRRSDARSKVIIVLTDGDNNAGNIAPLQAAGYAQKLGVKIHTILAGDNDPEAAAAAQAQAPRGLLQQPRPRFSANPQLLEQIASMTGGTPYLATDTQALAERFQKILEDLEKSRIKDRGILYAELYQRFLLGAFALLVLEMTLRLTRFRRLP
ncbi:MAG TPA: VWA domain-containing protein [Polyangia bacterium]|nr:VWA domain-containing protein [Polyangia bacterium]